MPSTWWTEDPSDLEDEHRATRGDHYGTVQTECPVCIAAALVRLERDGPLPSPDDHQAVPVELNRGVLVCRICGRPVRTANGGQHPIHAQSTIGSAHV